MKIVIQPGRGAVTRVGETASGTTRGTLVEREWVREPYSGYQAKDSTYPPKTANVNWLVGKRPDGQYVLTVDTAEMWLWGNVQPASMTYNLNPQ